MQQTKLLNMNFFWLLWCQYNFSSSFFCMISKNCVFAVSQFQIVLKIGDTINFKFFLEVAFNKLHIVLHDFEYCFCYAPVKLLWPYPPGHPRGHHFFVVAPTLVITFGIRALPSPAPIRKWLICIKMLNMFYFFKLSIFRINVMDKTTISEV